MRIGILGFGKEGKSVLRYLKRTPKYKQAEIVILDQARNPRYLQDLGSFDLIVKSPGVPFKLPEIQHALKKGVRFTSATRIFFEEAKGTLIGITGTKGKGTTATLLYKMLKAAGKDVYLAGNIGKPMLDFLPKLSKKSITILELSSFQLQNLGISPHIAVILHIYPDHLDAHKDFKEYLNAKAEISAHQSKKDTLFYVDGNNNTRIAAKKGRGRKTKVLPHAFKLFTESEMRVPGYHNFENAVVAASVAEHIKCKKEIIKQVATGFRGLPMRLELVASKKGINFYNDSASTTPYSAAAAVKAYKVPGVLLAGGKDKGFEYDALAKALKSSYVQCVVLFGENKAKIKAAISSSGIEITMAENLQRAVWEGLRFVKNHRQNQEEWAFMLSPGAASFDMFKDYKDRGEKFNHEVKKLEI